MEKVRPRCGQHSDRGRLKNRTEQNRTGISETKAWVYIFAVCKVALKPVPSYTHKMAKCRDHRFCDVTVTVCMLNHAVHQWRRQDFVTGGK